VKIHDRGCHRESQSESRVPPTRRVAAIEPVESVCSEVLVTFAVRTGSRWYRSQPSGWLIWSSLGAAVQAFAAPYSTMGQRYFGFAPVPLGVAAFVAGLLVAYFLAAELAMGPYFSRYGAPPPPPCR